MSAERSSATAPRGRLMVVDDDDSIRDVVTTALDIAGFEVISATSGHEALDLLAGEPGSGSGSGAGVDLIVLDVMMPGIDGSEVCRRLRATGDTTPIIFLTARDSPSDTLQGFALGGDDYMAKPFHLPELLARVDAVLRRATRASDAALGPRSGGDDDEIVVDDIVLDERGHRVHRDDAPVDLSPTEFRLLRYLMINVDAVVSKAQIAEHLWQFDLDSDGNIVETHISYLRKKLGPPRVIETVRGVGYVLRPVEP